MSNITLLFTSCNLTLFNKGSTLVELLRLLVSLNYSVFKAIVYVKDASIIKRKSELMKKKEMLNYIKETSDSIDNLMFVFKNRYFKISLPKIKNVIFVGSGSSYNTAHQASLFYENYLDLNVKTYHPDTFLSLKKINYNQKDTIVVITSETGTSTGTNLALDHAKKKGFKTITLTQKTNTPIATKGDYYFNFCCGDENCNAKTKGYTNNLILLYLIGTKLTQSEFNTNDLLAEINNVKDEITDLVADFPNWFDKNHHLVRMDKILVVGAEPYAGTTEEAALKMSETMLIPASNTTAEEFPHGFHRTINCNSSVFFINSSKYPLEKTCRYFRSKIDNLIVINTLDKKIGDFNLKKHKYYLESVTIGVIFQLFAYYLPTYLGLDPNRDANNDYDELINNRLS